jgi:hypothetical protein
MCRFMNNGHYNLLERYQKGKQSFQGFDAGNGEEGMSVRSGFLSKFRVGSRDLTGVAARKAREQIITFLDDTMLEHR